MVIAALLAGTPALAGAAAGSPCGEAQELLALGIAIGRECAGRCLERRAEIYAEAVGRCPDYPEGHNNLADIHEKLGHFDAADRHYRRAIEINPEFAAPYFGLADLSLAQGRAPEAIQAYEEGLRLDPDDDLSRRRLEEARVLVERSMATKEELTDVLSRTAATPSPVRLSERLLMKVLFETGSSELGEEGTSQVEAIAAGIAAAPRDTSFVIQGHADRRGGARHNRVLSRRRAEAVRDRLVGRFDVPSENLQIESFGEEIPLARGRNDTALSINRRVEVVQLRCGAGSSSAAR